MTSHPARSGPSVVDRESAEHYVWGDGCDGWRHLSEPDLSVIEERMPPSSAEVRHFHERARQVFFVLSGRLDIELDGTHHHLGDRQSLEIPPRSPHKVSNPGPDDTWFLVVSSPATRGDRQLA